jgi:hypothetical protein
MGFGQIWRDIISGLLCSSSTQVLLNGTPGKKIFHRRRLRQGDSLSLMLFILVMDALGHMFSKDTADDMLQPLARRVLPHRISIYADDVVCLYSRKKVILLSQWISYIFLVLLRDSRQTSRKAMYCQFGVRSRISMLFSNNSLVLSWFSHVSI